MERIEHGVAVGKIAFDCKRTSCDDNYNNRLSCLCNLCYELALRTLEVQVRERVGLAGKDCLFAYKYDCCVCSGSSGAHLCKRRLVPVTAVCKTRFPNHVVFLAKRGKRSNGVLFLTVKCPCAELVVRCVSKRTGNKNRLCLVKREDITLVLEKYR